MLFLLVDAGWDWMSAFLISSAVRFGTSSCDVPVCGRISLNVRRSVGGRVLLKMSRLPLKVAFSLAFQGTALSNWGIRLAALVLLCGGDGGLAGIVTKCYKLARINVAIDTAARPSPNYLLGHFLLLFTSPVLIYAVTLRLLRGGDEFRPTAMHDCVRAGRMTWTSLRPRRFGPDRTKAILRVSSDECKSNSGIASGFSDFRLVPGFPGLSKR
ncbi:MAG: hypothetical protein HZB14_03595 [Actinobacteria bacterium]|nr:hypothetical protein [Actinomycetota bacterium]